MVFNATNDNIKFVLPSSEVVAVIVAFSPFPFDVEALI
jgi:hypothetical protein